MGKSTLLNSLLGEKIAIISDKPQTTRNRILGIVTRRTRSWSSWIRPGIHKPMHKMNEFMVRTALATYNEVDVILMLVEATEATRRRGPVHYRYAEGREDPGLPADQQDRSRRKGEASAADAGVQHALSVRGNHPHLGSAERPRRTCSTRSQNGCRSGPQYFPDDQLTDQPERFIVSELIREKIFELTKEEIPYSTAVVIEEMKEEPEITRITAIIYVERDSQKGILIGKGGAMLKQIGTLARQDAEKLLGTKIFLQLWVKVKKGWREDENMLKNLGLVTEE